LLAISETDRAPEHCRRLLDHAFAGESAAGACLSTPIESFHRSQKVAHWCGGSASPAPNDLAADDIAPCCFEDFRTLWRGIWNDRLDRLDLTLRTR
jgi:hypothetical protein